MNIIELLSRIVLFPGTFMHEFLHLVAVKAIGLKVDKVCFIRLNKNDGVEKDSGGYIHFDDPTTMWQTLVICYAPLAGLIIGLPLLFIGIVFPVSIPVLIALYLGLAISICSFPSDPDIDAVAEWPESKRIGWLISAARVTSNTWKNTVFFVAFFIFVGVLKRYL